MNNNDYKTLNEVHNFWFGNLGSMESCPSEDKFKFWFGFSEDVDKEIRTKYTILLEKVATGELDKWRDSAQGSLVLTIILDQFPRQIYRKTERAFAYDKHALELATKTTRAGLDSNMHFAEKMFCYLPFSHCENKNMQHKSVSLFRNLLDKSSDAQYDAAALCLKMAREHLAIIARFNRFPHRNEVLGRVSTEEEIKYLAQENSRYGQ